MIWTLFSSTVYFVASVILMVNDQDRCALFLFLVGLAQVYNAYKTSLKVFDKILLKFILQIIKIKFYHFDQVSPKGKGVLITGCDSGFGHGLAIKLHSLGFTVFACSIDGTSEGAQKLKGLGAGTNRLKVIKIDITKQEQVDEALTFVERNLPANGLWGIVNNAGIGNVGPIEWMPIEDFENVSPNLLLMINHTTEYIGPY